MHPFRGVPDTPIGSKVPGRPNTCWRDFYIPTKFAASQTQFLVCGRKCLDNSWGKKWGVSPLESSTSFALLFLNLQYLTRKEVVLHVCSVMKVNQAERRLTLLMPLIFSCKILYNPLFYLLAASSTRKSTRR